MGGGVHFCVWRVFGKGKLMGGASPRRVRLQFHLAYLDKGRIVSDRKLVAMNYLKTWFFVPPAGGGQDASGEDEVAKQTYR